MPSQYPQEQLNKLYEKLPKELQTALFSEETAEVIGNACSQYGIEDERVAEVAKHVGDVLMGFILPSELEDALRKNVDLPEVLFKPIASEINRFTFYPVKQALEQIHRQPGEDSSKQGIGVATPRHSNRLARTAQEQENGYIVEESEETDEEPKEVFSAGQTEKDPYRESL